MTQKPTLSSLMTRFSEVSDIIKNDNLDPDSFKLAIAEFKDLKKLIDDEILWANYCDSTTLISPLLSTLLILALACLIVFLT